MTVNFKVRRIGKGGKIKEKDLKVLESLEERTFGDSAPPCDKTRGDWWIIYDEEKPVAFCGMYSDYNDNFAFLCKVGVIKSYRRMGLHTKMIKLREREAKNQGLERIITYTSRDNYPSANNLIKCKYQLYDPQVKFGVSDGLYFCKDI